VSVTSRPACTVESHYWSDGLRWKVVLQVMYYATPRRAEGPFFVIGHTRRESAAREMAEKANARLARSEEEMAEILATLI
jgi:aminoglycoside phosphotransferase (APT) family kinase protein